MSRFKFAACLFLFLPLLSTHAELSFRNSEDFESYQSGKSFEGDTLPEKQAAFPWVRKGGQTDTSATCEDGVLTYRSGGKEGSALSWSAKGWDGRPGVETGWTIEVRVKVQPGGAFALVAASGNGIADDEVFIVRENSLLWGTKILAGEIDNTNRFHTFRIARSANGGYDIWRDGEPVGDQEHGTQNLEDRFGFGDLGGAPGGVQIDYLRWDTTGPYCP